MPYTLHTEDDRRAMLAEIGVPSEDALFDAIPERFRLRDPLPIGEGKSEHETLRVFAELADGNRPASALVSFLGGGIYDHFVPAAVRNVASRPEFATAYTPYQPEVSQGTLQVIFEFQTHIARITGLPVANASMYDGASALAEASLMAAKITGRDVILCPETLNPRYLRVVQRYLEGQRIALRVLPALPSGQVDAAAIRDALGERVAAVLLQTPNYFGLIESPWEYEAAVHDAGALLVAAVDPISLGVFRAPGEYGADIAVGEGQTLGNDMSFGGPLLGFMACRETYIRRMPGRIVSATRDVDGRDAFVLILQTREQHIRREKATSNICTNQGLLAARATVYLSLLGERGFAELSRVCCARARRLAALVGACPGYGLRYAAPYFREFVLACPTDARRVAAAARRRGVLAGIPLEKYFGEKARRDLLVAVTEKHTDADFEALCAALREAA